METRCYGSKKTSALKHKATWVGNSNKVLRQFWASIKSYLVYPFVKKNAEATRKFFEAIYSDRKEDDLIFDGNDHAYLEKAKEVIDTTKQYDCIYDCGCGNGSFYHFAKNIQIQFNKYLGIDFAVMNQTTSPDKEFITSNIASFEFYDQFNTRLVVLCNVACYLSNEEFGSLLKKCAKDGTFLLLIDPIPGLFWDATFEQVKLFYRKPKKTEKLLESYGYVLECFSKDYLINVCSKHFFPLSYASFFQFKKDIFD